MTRKILLLEANAYAGEDLLDAAADLGVDVHVATHAELYDKYRPELTSKIAGTVFTDFADADGSLADLVDYSRTEGIDGVVTAWEFLSPLTTRLAAALGLPGHDPEFADAVRNKRVMAEALEAHGAPVPRTLVVDSLEDALARIAESGWEYPLVIKPAENAGSVGVSVVDSAAEVPDAVELAKNWTHEFPHNIALETTVLVQEYVGGDEYSVETVLADGQVHHLAVTQKHTTDTASRAELGHTIPAGLSAPARETVLAAIDQAIAALGLRNGVAHSEVKLERDGTAKIIEVGARPPGDNIMKLVLEAFGISEAKAYLQVALGDRPDVEPRRKAAAAIRFLTSPKAGVLKEISGVPESAAVVASALYSEPGQEVGGPQDNIGRVGHVIFRAETAEEVNRIAAAGLAGVTIEVG